MGNIKISYKESSKFKLIFVFHFIKRRPITAMALPKIFLDKSSLSCKKIAAPINIKTILKVVIEETKLRLPTVKSITT